MHDLQTKMFKSAKKQCCGDHKNNEKDTGGLKISAIATPKEKPKKSSEPVNEDTIEGNWKHLMQDAQKQWSKLTNDNLAQINGSREKLAQALQKNYSIASEEAEKQMKEWEKSRSNTVKSATNS